MNETIKLIKERRSVRVFKEDQISDEVLNEILEAGLYAPSAMNAQSWHFTVIQNHEVLEKITVAAKETFSKLDSPHFKSLATNDKYKVFYNAPTAIIISGDSKSYSPELDCSAAAENIMLAAKALGVGSCWIGSMQYIFGNGNNDALKKDLEIPEGFKPLIAISLGYAANETSKAPDRKPNKVNFIK